MNEFNTIGRKNCVNRTTKYRVIISKEDKILFFNKEVCNWELAMDSQTSTETVDECARRIAKDIACVFFQQIIRLKEELLTI